MNIAYCSVEYPVTVPILPPVRQPQADAEDDALLISGDNGVPTETQFFIMAVTLIFEFSVETVPQITIQAYNNTVRQSWTPFTIFSIAVSSYIAVEGIWRVLILKCTARVHVACVSAVMLIAYDVSVILC